MVLMHWVYLTVNPIGEHIHGKITNMKQLWSP
uniref:Uncharacterized protein n=1 Tax=Arundo donax TaxID=35708 RepID=A0A0A9BXH0_ARUDO